MGPPNEPRVVVNIPAVFTMEIEQLTEEPPILFAVPEVFPVAHAGENELPQSSV